MTNWREGACEPCNQGILDVEPCRCPPTYSEAEVAELVEQARAPYLALADELIAMGTVSVFESAAEIGQMIREAGSIRDAKPPTT